MIQRWAFVTISFFFLQLRADYSFGQYSPIGGHYALMGKGSGFGSDSISLFGTFQTTVPLSFPSPRGDLSLPIAIVYDGGNQVGEAGVGWYLPFSYVMRSSSLSRRKPKFTFTASYPEPAERLFLSLGGRLMLMNPVGPTYRPMVADAYLELRQFSVQNKWVAYDSGARSYTFSSIEALRDDSLWFLTEITDRTGNNKILFQYEVDNVVAPTGTNFPELMLTEVSYSFTSGNCPKHRIVFDYCVPGEPGCGPGTGSILRYVLDHGHVRVRQKLLNKITVWSHADKTCSETPDKILRTYNFYFESDKDTALPRLSKVDLRGTGPYTGEEPSLPVAQYSYGSTTTKFPFWSKVLRFEPTGFVQLPWAVTNAQGAFSSMVETARQYSTQQLFADFTGDGLPDYIDPGSPFGVPGHLLLVRNRTDVSGTTFDATLLNPLFPDSDVQVRQLSLQETLTGRYTEHHQSNFTDTAIQLIDWNGDGRLDVVDAKGGIDQAGNSSPYYWRVLLNTPDPTPSDPDKIVWRPRQVLIKHIRDSLENREQEVLLPAEYTPVARSQTSGRVESHGCRTYVFSEADGKWHLANCTDSYPELEGICIPTIENPCTGIVAGSTITEWKLLDVNGDGLPDVVFNEKGLKATQKDSEIDKTSCFYECPEVTTDPADCPRECSDFAELNLPPDNHILVFYNINGAGQSYNSQREFSERYEVLFDEGRCGVERWTESSPSLPGHQRMSCGFVEVNGDGLVDYTKIAGYDGPWLALLNGGIPRDQGFTFNEAAAIELPGPPGKVSNNHFATCEPEAASPTSPPPPIDGDTKYYVRHLSALTDITGDGIPDYIFFDKKSEHSELPLWMVSIGTGNSFLSPLEIASSAGPFELSLVEEQCAGLVSKTVAGIMDLDGDGRLDLVHATETTPGTPAILEIYKIIGASGSIGAHDTGRLIGVSNGYGGTTSIQYSSAKTDTKTAHKVPFSEIVVSQIRNTAEKGLGASFEAVRFAYGKAHMRYHALLARWIFPGYGRQVMLTGLGTRAAIHTGLDLEGTAQITDTIGPEELLLGINNYSFAGRVRAIHFLDGSFNKDPTELLPLNVSTDSRWHASINTKYEIKRIGILDDPSPIERECYDVYPYSAAPALWPDALQLCRRAVIVYTSETTSWEGSHPPPSGESVERRTFIGPNVDEFARPLSIWFQNDTSRLDDDFCLELSYAEPDPLKMPVLDSVYTSRVTGCAGAQGAVYAGVRYQYDSLPEGQVGSGLMSQRTLERYNATSGEKLEEFVFDSFTHDKFGNVVSVTMKNGDLTYLKKIDYDAFGILPEQILESAGHTDLTIAMHYDPVSMVPLSVIDSNNTEFRTSYDRFGRPELSTVLTYPDRSEYLLSKTEYLGDNPSDAEGRRIKNVIAQSWMLKDALTDTAPRPPNITESTAYFDEFDRLRFLERPLGIDYDNKTLELHHIEYDGLGRPSFLAFPFEKDSEALRYGINYHYYPDNRIQCVIQGEGYQSLGFVTNESLDLYPTCFNYSVVDHQAVLQMKGPNEFLRSAPQEGAFDELRTTAIGRVISAARVKSGIRLELTEYDYNRLGHLSDISRFKRPSLAGAGLISWSFLYDSLGQLIEIREPGASIRKRQYDVWGNVVETSWEDTTLSPTVTRALHNTYDAFGRLTKVEHLENGIADPRSRLQYFYDVPSTDPEHLSPLNLRGRLAFTGDDTLRTYFGYDSLGHVTQITRVNLHDPEKRLFTEQRKYTPGHQITNLYLQFAKTDEEQEEVKYLYDSARQVRSVELTDSRGTSSLFDAEAIDVFGRYLQIRLGNDVSETYTYRANRRRELLQHSIVNKTDTRTISYLGYDGENRLKAQREDVTSTDGVSPPAKITAYTYNALNQLARARTIQGTLANPIREESFLYDSLGNIAKINDHVRLSSLRLIQDREDPDRLCRTEEVEFVPESPQFVPIPGSETGPCTYFYDSIGNVTKIKDAPDSSRAFSYDVESRLIFMQNGSASSELRYDALNDLSEHDFVDSSSGTMRRDRHYGSLFEEFVTIGTPPVIERRIPGPTGIICSRRGSGDHLVTLYHHGDSTANRLFTDKEGKVAQSVDYRPYGDIAEDTGTEGSETYTKYLWNRGESFNEFGVTHLGARVYSPVIGRFLQRDPLTLLHSAAGANPYTFGLRDPVNFSDPTGRDAQGAYDWNNPFCDYMDPRCNYSLETSAAAAATLGLWNIIEGGSQGRTSAIPLPTIPEPTIMPYDIFHPVSLVQPLGETSFEKDIELWGGKVAGGKLRAVVIDPVINAPVGYIVSRSSEATVLVDRNGGDTRELKITSGAEGGLWYDPVDLASGVVAGKLLARVGMGVVARAGAEATEEAALVTSKRMGDLWRDTIAEELRKIVPKGWTVVVEHPFATPFATRKWDVAVFNELGKLVGGIEAKAGGSVYKIAQQLKDEWIMKKFGVPVFLYRYPWSRPWF